MTHRKIMSKCAKRLEKDAEHYSKDMKGASKTKKKNDKIERKEAISAARDLKKRARLAHEY